MDVDQLFKETMELSENSERKQAGTNVAKPLRDLMEVFCKAKRLTISQGFDMALYYFLYAGGMDFAEFRVDSEPLDSPILRHWKICNKCTTTFKDSETCTKCESMDVTKVT